MYAIIAAFIIGVAALLHPVWAPSVNEIIHERAAQSRIERALACDDACRARAEAAELALVKRWMDKTR